MHRGVDNLDDAESIVAASDNAVDMISINLFNGFRTVGGDWNSLEPSKSCLELVRLLLYCLTSSNIVR